MQKEYGKLYIVATPIGNLSDITYRAIDVLNEVDIIAAEDTRNTQKLLNHFDIKKKIISYHEHNKYDKADVIIEMLKEGQNIAIVTDAGTPIISDPGSVLVDLAIQNDITVTSVPGACAVINAVVLSNLNSAEFYFVGFLNDDKKKRLKKLDDIKNFPMTLVIYISPHKIKKFLKDIIEVLGEDRKACLCREMTKIHEEVKRNTLKELNEYYEVNEAIGEMVLVIEGKNIEEIKLEQKKQFENISIEEQYKKLLDEGMGDKDAIKKIAELRDMKKNEVYKLLKIK